MSEPGPRSHPDHDDDGSLVDEPPPTRIEPQAEPPPPDGPGRLPDQRSAAPELAEGPEPSGVRRRRREHPLLICTVGEGRGKTTEAAGQLLRGWAQGWPVAMVELRAAPLRSVGGLPAGERPDPGERHLAEVLQEVEDVRGGSIDWWVVGDGWPAGADLVADPADAIGKAWEEIERWLREGTYRMLALDELGDAVAHGWLPLDRVLEALRARAGFQHVIVTGREAPAELLEAADMVTEMVERRHPSHAGQEPQKGVEW